MTNTDLTSDEEIRLEIQKLDAEEQAALVMAQSSETMLMETLQAIKGLGPRIQEAMEENNVEEMHAQLNKFIENFSMMVALIPNLLNSLQEANEAKLWKDKYEFLLTLPAGE